MNQKRLKIGVIAGTPVDTQMGVDFFTSKGYEAFGIPTASSPEEQNLLQFLNPSALTEKVKNIIRDFERNLIVRTVIYCNSLSSAIDLDSIKKTFPQSQVVTPLDIYSRLAVRHNKVMLWAANGQCLAGIEKIFYENNPSIEITGLSMLPVIKAIEARVPPEVIIQQFNLTDLIDSQNKAECLVLGCTHLPYLKQNLKQKAGFPIIDPAEEMLCILQQQ